jgi:hypothetical protein
LKHRVEYFADRGNGITRAIRWEVMSKIINIGKKKNNNNRGIRRRATRGVQPAIGMIVDVVDDGRVDSCRYSSIAPNLGHYLYSIHLLRRYKKYLLKSYSSIAPV